MRRKAGTLLHTAIQIEEVLRGGGGERRCHSGLFVQPLNGTNALITTYRVFQITLHVSGGLIDYTNHLTVESPIFEDSFEPKKPLNNCCQPLETNFAAKGSFGTFSAMSVSCRRPNCSASLCSLRPPRTLIIEI